MSESIVQKKLAERIRRELSSILNRSEVLRGTMVTISVVRVTADLSIAKIYMTIFPESKGEETIEKVNKQAWEYRMSLGKVIRHEVRKIPELRFLLDDSFQEAEKIDRLLRDNKKDQDS